MITNHYGRQVDSESPVTGVIHQSSPEHLIKEILYHGEDVECHECSRRPCYSMEDCEDCECIDHTILIGDWSFDNGAWAPDETGDKRYAAIANANPAYIQIVWSAWTRHGALCSPCYPGQVDLDTRGAYLAYDVPPDMYGDRGPEPEA